MYRSVHFNFVNDKCRETLNKDEVIFPYENSNMLF